MPPQLTALLIEDDPLQASTTASILASAGFEPRVAHTGSDAIDALTHRPFDLIIVDLYLPDTPGSRLIEVLRGAPNGAAAKILAVTSSDDHIELRNAFLSGADDVYQKAIGLNVLAAKFESLAVKFKAEALMVGRLMELEEKLHTHSEELQRCSQDKDAQIAEMSTLLKQIAADTASVREIVTVWSQAKAFGGGVRTVAVVIWTYKRQIAFATGLITALIMWAKTGIWHFAWPK